MNRSRKRKSSWSQRIYSDGTIESKSDIVGFVRALANASESLEESVGRIADAVAYATVKIHTRVNEAKAQHDKLNAETSQAIQAKEAARQAANEERKAWDLKEAELRAEISKIEQGFKERVQERIRELKETELRVPSNVL